MKVVTVDLHYLLMIL